MVDTNIILGIIGTIIAISTVLNTISRWSAVRETVSRYQDRDLKRLEEQIKYLEDRLNEIPLNYVLNTHFHDESNKLWNALDRKGGRNAIR